jgi:hypothetical protein
VRNGVGSAPPSSGFSFEISLSVLNHLGRNLYRNFITVLGEAISNSWDADATDVWINIDRPSGKFIIKDDGIGMSVEDFQDKFLRIGYSKRRDGVTKTASGRPYIGAKGIGKLALLSCAKRISIFSKTEAGEYVGGVIDNAGLDNAIKGDLTPDQYPLEKLDFSLVEGLTGDHNSGTIIVFEGANEILTSSEEQIRKLLAMSFRFSLFDPDFNIYVNDEQVSIDDLKDLADATEFIWVINDYSDEFTKSLSNLKADAQKFTTELPLKGFIATVEYPRDLKIRGTEERATVDLFANGRLREKNVIRHIPTQRIAESYMYGQLHYDILDQKDADPFTSSREGIVQGDPDFEKLMAYLKGTVLNQIIEEDWDKLRLSRGEEGDDENPRVPKRQRRAVGLYTVLKDDFRLEAGAKQDEVDRWLNELQPDAAFNLASYGDCYLAENLLRKGSREKGVKLTPEAEQEIKEWKGREAKRKGDANISFEIRENNDDLSYLGMDYLALSIEGKKPATGTQSLWTDAVSYKPVRNAVGHTGLLTNTAKSYLNVTFENIRGRVKTILKQLGEKST